MNATDFLIALARNSVAGGVLVILVLLAQRVFRRQLSPAWHCALWLLVIARLLPVSFPSGVSVFNLLPRWAAAAPTASIAPDPGASAITAPSPISPVIGSLPSQPFQPVIEVTASDDGRPSRFTPLSADPIAALFWFWLAGAAALTVVLVSSSAVVAQRTTRGTPVVDTDVLARLRDCCDRMEVRRMPALWETAAITTPAVHGLLRPRILLPLGFPASFSAEEQCFVFLHELAHVRRFDLWLNWLVAALQILHWFNPLVWLAFARWRVDREIACDAAAIEAAGAGTSRFYGATMLRLLENIAEPRRHPGLVGILEDNRPLRRRMKMIAAFAPARRPFTAMGVLAILALVGLTDAQVVPSESHPVARAAADNPPASADAIATVIADQFGGDRRMFLTYLKDRGLTLREFRREVAAHSGATSGTSARNPTVPAPAVPYVLFLVNSSETMLAEFPISMRLPEAQAENRERGQPFVRVPANATNDEKRSTPKWQRTAQTLDQLLRALPAETNFQVRVFSDATVEPVGGRGASQDADAIPKTIARLLTIVPHGDANLEAAFAFVADELSRAPPERIVLLTDGLPTTSHAAPKQDTVSETRRIDAFKAASRRLPPGIPVHTVLMTPPTSDPAAAGLYWELAHATNGQVTVPATIAREPRSHLALVIDTSGSMRDPANGGLWPVVIDTVEVTLDQQPQLVGLQLLDADGRFILGRKGAGAAGWLPNTTETREMIRRVLRRYDQDTVSNPAPGIYNAIRFLHEPASGFRMGIHVFGDELNSSDNAGSILGRIDTLNPRDATGRRAITISASGFPTTIRARSSMANTGLRFANLMRLLAAEHDGSFIALPQL